MIRLAQVQQGCEVIFISAAGGQGIMRKITDMGLIAGEKMTVIQNTGHGQVIILVKGSRLAIGHKLAEKIAVREV